jgi:hypothetical protein
MSSRDSICKYCGQKRDADCIQPKWVTVVQCPKFVRRGQNTHREKMSEAVGRELSKDEHVHHINGNHRDNRIDNLLICSRSEHMKIHSLMRRGISRADAIQAILDNRPSWGTRSIKTAAPGMRSNAFHNASSLPAKD